MLLSEKVQIVWEKRNKKLFTDKGFEFTKYGDKFEVSVYDLADNSSYKVDVQCDYCGTILKKKFSQFRDRKEIVDKDACSNCSGKKIGEIKELQKQIRIEVIKKNIGDCKNKIPLETGQFILVDEEDFDDLICYTPNLNSEGMIYITVKDNGKWQNVPIHRFLLGLNRNKDRDKEVLHINGNKLDNRKQNLVIKDRSRPYSKPASKLGYKGVSKATNSNSYEVRIYIKNKTERFGNYSTIESAANAYNYYAKIYHGELAFQNDVPYMPKEEWEKYLCKMAKKEARYCQCGNEIAKGTKSKCVQCISRESELKKKQLEEVAMLKKKIQEAKRIERIEQKIQARSIVDKRKNKREKYNIIHNINGIEHKLCNICNEMLPLDNFYSPPSYKEGKYQKRCKKCICEKTIEWKNENIERWKEIRNTWRRTWRINNPLKYKAETKAREHRRRAKEKALVGTLSSYEWQIILDSFDNKCALTNNIDIHMEHFIPLSWGHGGTYFENIYPLCAELNISKSDKNPFEWAKSENIDLNRWNQLIDYLASLNGLSPTEFEDFVYWCENNKRTVEQIQADGDKTSLELYLEARELYLVC